MQVESQVRRDAKPGLVDRLETTRQSMRRFQLRSVLLRVVLVELCLAGLLAFADWLWVLSTPTRTAGLVVLALAAAVLFYRGVIASRRRFGREEAAAEVESSFPELGQRVRTTVEYVEPTPATTPASPELVFALATDTERRTRGLNFLRVIPWRSLIWLQAAVALVALVYAGLLIWDRELRVAALRCLLLPVHYTQLDVQPGDKALKVGADLSIQANVTGRPVATVDLLYREAGSGNEWTRRSLAPEDGTSDAKRKLLGNLETTLTDYQEDLEYRVVAGSIDSQVYHLTLVRPLVLKKLEGTITPPAYTRQPTKVVNEGNFAVIEGSKVQFRFTLDRAPQDARLLLYPRTDKDKPAGGPPQAIALAMNGKELTGELALVDKELDYEITAEAADGMRLDPSRFRIRVKADSKPTIRFLRPKEQIEVTPTTEVTMRLEAKDDFGLAKVGIVYQIGNGPKKTLYLKEDAAQPVALLDQVILPLEEHKLNFQDGVTYYAFAQDNHPNQPHRASTELQFIDIRPYKRAYQILDGGGGC